MTKQLTLHELIDLVKEELLTPTDPATAEAMYPFLFVEEVELAVNVSVEDTLSDSGKLTLYVLEASLAGEKMQQQGHSIKIKLTPLVTKDEMRTRLRLDDRLWKRIEEQVVEAHVKETELAEG